MKNPTMYVVISDGAFIESVDDMVMGMVDEQAVGRVITSQFRLDCESHIKKASNFPKWWARKLADDGELVLPDGIKL